MNATDIRSQRILYGCMGLGGGWDTQPYTAADIGVAEAAIEAALDAGITAFDHADIYRHGKAEAVFGEILARDAGLRERITLQTKCGIRLPGPGRIGRYDLSADHIRQRVGESLDRLRTDHLDVLLLHRPDPLAEPEPLAAALTDLHQQGMVRQFGVSNFSGAQIAYLQQHLDLPLVVDQLQLSLAHPDLIEAGVLFNTSTAAAYADPGTLEHCQANRIGVQAWAPLAQGRFTGRPADATDEATAQLAVELAEARNTTVETIVLWWLRRHPARIAPVIGTTRPDRIRACRDVAGREPELSHDEWYQLWVTARGRKLP